MRLTNTKTLTLLDQSQVGDDLVTTVRHVNVAGYEVAEVTATHQRMKLRLMDDGVEHVFAERMNAVRA